jgi:hypothetical protein
VARIEEGSRGSDTSLRIFSTIYGDPSFVNNTRFIRRSGRPSSRVAPRNDRVEWTNNLGELMLSDRTVSHFASRKAISSVIRLAFGSWMMRSPSGSETPDDSASTRPS